MKRNLNLSVPNPCAEKWENFTRQAGGGYCGACNKTVVDFTKMSDRQLLEYLKDKQAHTCGRFRSDQLRTYAFDDMRSVTPGLALFRAAAVGLLLMLAGRPVVAQSTPSKEVTAVTQQEGGITETQKAVAQEREFTVAGTIKYEDELLAGANVLLKGTTTGTMADEYGRFVFPKKLKAGDVLVVTFIGFLPEEYTVPQNFSGGEVSISVTMIAEIMGDMVVGTVSGEEIYTAAPESPGLWARVKGWFK